MTTRQTDSEATALRRARLCIILAMAGFAAIGVLSRQAGVGVLTVSFYRSLLVALSFLALHRWHGGSLADLRPTVHDMRVYLVPYGVAVSLASTTFVGGYILTSYANTLFLHNLAPLFVFLLAWPFFKERARPQEIAGACVGIAGVACISGVSLAGFLTFADGRQIMGDVLALLSAVAYALVLIYTRRVRQAGLGLYSSLFWMWTVATLTLVLPNAAWGSFALGGKAAAWVLLLAILCTTVPFVLLNLGMREIRAGEASILAQSEVLFGLVLGFALYGESLSALAMMGGVLIVCGILVARDESSDGVEEADEAPAAPSLAEGPLLLSLGVYVVALDVQAVTALLAGSSVAMAAVGVMLTGGLSLLVAGAENRWGRQRLLVGLTALLAAVLSLAVVALCGVRALALPAGAGASPGLALGGLLAGAAGFAAAMRHLRRCGHGRAASRCGAAAGAMAVACVGQSLAMIGFALDRAFVGASCVLGLLLAVEASASGTGALAPGRGLAFLSERRLVSPRLLRWGGAALLVVYVTSGLFVVRSHQAAVAQVFGVAGPVLGPGLHYALPWPFGRVTVIDGARSRVATIGVPSKETSESGLQEALMLTGDDNIADVEAAVEYRISDPGKWLFAVSDPEGLVRAGAEAVLRELVATTGTDELLVAARGRLQDEARERLQRALESAGVQVVAFRVLDVKPPPAVMASFLDVVSAGEDRNTSVNQAWAYQASLLPETRGERARRVAEAQAQARSQVEHALGDARRFTDMVAPYAASVGVTSFRLYVETLEEGLRDVEKYVVDPGLSVEFRYKRGASSPAPQKESR